MKYTVTVFYLADKKIKLVFSKFILNLGLLYMY